MYLVYAKKSATLDPAIAGIAPQTVYLITKNSSCEEIPEHSCNKKLTLLELGLTPQGLSPQTLEHIGQGSHRSNL